MLKSGSGKGKCTCSPLHLLVGLVLMSLGLFVVMGGIRTQLGEGWNAYMTVLPLYFFGLLLLVVGKFVKYMSHGNCPAHGCMCE